jgi:hypothetical protein
LSNLYPAFIHHFSNLGPSTRPSSSRLSALCPAFLQPLYLPFIHPVCTFFQPICYPHFIFLPTFRPPLAHLLSNLYPAESSPYPPFIQHLSNLSPSFFQLFSCPLSSFYPTSVQYPPFITLYPIFPPFIHPLSRPSPTVAFHSPVFPLYLTFICLPTFIQLLPALDPVHPVSALYPTFIRPLSNLFPTSSTFYAIFSNLFPPLSILYPPFIHSLSNLYPTSILIYRAFIQPLNLYLPFMQLVCISRLSPFIQRISSLLFIQALSNLYFYPRFIQFFIQVLSSLYPQFFRTCIPLPALHPAVYHPFIQPISNLSTYLLPILSQLFLPALDPPFKPFPALHPTSIHALSMLYPTFSQSLSNHPASIHL